MVINYILGSRDREVFGAYRVTSNILNLLKSDLKVLEYERHKIPFLGELNYFYYPYDLKKEFGNGHINHFTTQTDAYMLNFVNARNSVVTCLDIIPYVFIKDYANNFFSRYKIRSWVKGLRKADRIITISRFTKREVVKHLKVDPGRVHVAHLGVDHSTFKPLKGEKFKEKTLLYVGSEQPRKNFDKLLLALTKIKSNCKLIKVGSPQWDRNKKTFDFIKKHNLNVEFLDNINDKRLSELYNRVDAFVFPSVYEGFGLPPLEAMACGCPVLTTDKASIPEVVGDAYLKIEPNNVNDFAKKIDLILNDSSLRRKLSAKGKTRAKKFTWENTANKVKTVYSLFDYKLR